MQNPAAKAALTLAQLLFAMRPIFFSGNSALAVLLDDALLGVPIVIRIIAPVDSIDTFTAS